MASLPSGAIDQNINGTTYFALLSAVLQWQQRDLRGSRQTMLRRETQYMVDHGACRFCIANRTLAFHALPEVIKASIQ